MSTPRVNLGQAAPDLYKAVAGLDGLVGRTEQGQSLNRARDEV